MMVCIHNILVFEQFQIPKYPSVHENHIVVMQMLNSKIDDTRNDGSNFQSQPFSDTALAWTSEEQ